jgi:hypothetical protein
VLLAEFEATCAFGSAEEALASPRLVRNWREKRVWFLLPCSLDLCVNELFLAGLGEPNWLISMRHGLTWLSKAKQKLS